MKKYIISGLVNQYRIKVNFFAISPEEAIKFGLIDKIVENRK